jgi:hypothetical protein
MKFIYAIASDVNGPCKIGISGNVEKRLKQLQTGHSSPLKIFHSVLIERDDVHILEKTIHKTLVHLKLKGEWFNIDAVAATQEIDYAVMRYGDKMNMKL